MAVRPAAAKVVAGMTGAEDADGAAAGRPTADVWTGAALGTAATMTITSAAARLRHGGMGYL